MDATKTVEYVGRRIGRAIAQDVIAEGMPRDWTGLDAQDVDQIPDGMDRDAVEVVAKREYMIHISPTEET